MGSNNSKYQPVIATETKNRPIIATEIKDGIDTEKITKDDIDHISKCLRNDSDTPFKFNRRYFGIDLEFEIIYYCEYNSSFKIYLDDYKLYYNGILLKEYGNHLNNLFDDIDNFEKRFVYYNGGIISIYKHNCIIDLKKSKEIVAKIIKEKLNKK
uniref:Uncharacterized protein n=1 Tax=viral metagenome TaxID=1070528 RepID=A0A6C0H607_9ZZZZ